MKLILNKNFMKKTKRIVLTSLAVFAFGVMNAQNVKFGVKAGINVSTLNGEKNVSPKLGLAIGGFAELKLSEKFSLQPEVQYSSVGAESDASNDMISMSYIYVPVMAKYYVANKFSLEAGPQIGFLTSAKYVQIDKQVQTMNAKDLFKSTDLGLNFGAGYDINDNIQLSVRYSAGLSDVYRDEFGLLNDVKNSNLALNFAYKF